MMKLFNSLTLRTKLIGSYVLFALIAIGFTIVVSFNALNALFDTAIPTITSVVRIGLLTNKVEANILKYVATGEQEAANELNLVLARLMSEQMEGNQSGVLEELGMSDLLNRAGLLGNQIVRSHRQTLGELTKLQKLNNESETLFSQISNIIAVEDAKHLQEADLDAHLNNAHPTRVNVDRLFNAVEVIQLEALEYVAVGERDAIRGFSQNQVELNEILAELRSTADTDGLLTAEMFEQLDALSIQISETSEAVVNSHTNTLDLLEEYNAVSQQMEQAIDRAQTTTDEATASEIDVLQRNFIILSAVVLLLALLGAWLTTRGILGPIQWLVSSARQIGAGDLSVRADVNSQDEIGQLATVFNQMVGQLQDAFAHAEQESERRIRQLELNTEISRQLTTMLDVDQALQYSVTKIQETFGFYHAHVYLRDPATGELEMREGSGEVGRQLKAAGHRLPAGQGIVGQVANTGQPLLAPNVDQIIDFVRNPLLPKTQAELAVPLRKGSLVLGVLDLQSEEAGGFTEEDQKLMQSIADQMAVVIDNARLFREVRTVAAEAEALNRRLTLATWADITEKSSASGYVFTKSGVTPIAGADLQRTDEQTWLAIMNEAVRKKELTYHREGSSNGSDQPNVLSVPLILRDEVIGVIGIERAAPPTAGAGNQKSAPAAWTDDEIITIQAITDQVTQALDAARLAQETQRAAWRDRVVSESTAEVWATDEIEEVMRAAVTQLGDRLRASEVVIRLGKEEDVLKKDDYQAE